MTTLFKIDENLHEEVAAYLRSLGYDALSVYEQQLQGHADSSIAAVCQQEQRTLITLDLDFSNILLYPPADYPGIIVLRLTDQSRPAVLAVIQRLVPMLAAQSPTGQLWIVDESTVRIRTA